MSAFRTNLRYLSGGCPGQVSAAGGTYLVRGGELEVLEGDWHPKRVVVIRFDSKEAARRERDLEEDAIVCTMKTQIISVEGQAALWMFGNDMETIILGDTENIHQCLV